MNSPCRYNKNEICYNVVFEEVVSPAILKVQRKRVFTNQLQQQLLILQMNYE